MSSTSCVHSTCASVTICPFTLQVHARTQTLATNAVAQLDSIFAYIASHLAANASTDVQSSASDTGSPHRGLNRRCVTFIISHASAASPSRSISDGAPRRGRALHLAAGGHAAAVDQDAAPDSLVFHRRADSDTVGSCSGIRSLGSRNASDGSAWSAVCLLRAAVLCSHVLCQCTTLGLRFGGAGQRLGRQHWRRCANGVTQVLQTPHLMLHVPSWRVSYG